MKYYLEALIAAWAKMLSFMVGIGIPMETAETIQGLIVLFIVMWITATIAASCKRGIWQNLMRIILLAYSCSLFYVKGENPVYMTSPLSTMLDCTIAGIPLGILLNIVLSADTYETFEEDVINLNFKNQCRKIRRLFAGTPEEQKKG